MRWWFLFLAAACVAQATEPKAKATDYPLHAPSPKAEIGVDFHVRTVFGARQSFVLDDYLVVEVAFFPKEPLLISTSHLTLRLDGKKTLFAQTPGIVAASVKYPDWGWYRGPSVEAQSGDQGIRVGGPPTPVERFPGDRRDPRTTTPRQPRADASATGVEIEKENPAEVVTSQALTEGERDSATSGYVYFAHKGELRKLKSIELVYQQPNATPVVLRLR